MSYNSFLNFQGGGQGGGTAAYTLLYFNSYLVVLQLRISNLIVNLKSDFDLYIGFVNK